MPRTERVVAFGLAAVVLAGFLALVFGPREEPARTSRPNATSSPSSSR